MSGAGDGGANTPNGLGRAFDAAQPEPGALHLDHERYAAHLAELEVSDEDAAAFLQAIWSIMVAFADIGWGIDTVRQACGQTTTALIQSALEGADPVNWSDRTIEKTGNRAQDRSSLRARPTQEEA